MLSRTDARRLAVRAQLLGANRPSGMFDVVRRLTLLQNDPAAAVAPSADLVLWSRLGSSYSPTRLRDALAEQALLELHGLIRPPEDLALYRAEMAEWPGRPPLRDWQEGLREWVDANNGCRQDILARLRADAPLAARELPDTCVIPWRSSGWTNNELLGRSFAGRAALLSPLDRLVYDRKRIAELFEYDYQLEMFKPAAKRRWGYWALPILYGDRLVGKLDATADRGAGVLRVDAIHRDVPFTKAMTAAVRHEIEDLAGWLGLDLTLTT
jgi:uncharacterized protein YcaQ